jgi:hypothetical protein
VNWKGTAELAIKNRHYIQIAGKMDVPAISFSHTNLHTLCNTITAVDTDVRCTSAVEPAAMRVHLGNKAEKVDTVRLKSAATFGVLYFLVRLRFYPREGFNLQWRLNCTYTMS